MSTVSDLIVDWQAARTELWEMEKAEHTDIVDRFGRVWTWKSNDTYRHCGNAAPAHMINDFGLPTQAALDNPNYDLCSICIGGRERKVPACKPEWNCSHTMHQASEPAVLTLESATRSAADASRTWQADPTAEAFDAMMSAIDAATDLGATNDDIIDALPTTA